MNRDQANVSRLLRRDEAFREHLIEKEQANARLRAERDRCRERLESCEAYFQDHALDDYEQWLVSRVNDAQSQRLTIDEASAVLDALDAGLIDEGGEAILTAVEKLRAASEADKP